MSVNVEPILEELAAGQWGLFTTAQAKNRGVNRANLSHRERDGRVERLTHGVYRLGGVPVSGLDNLRAAWLSTEPTQLSWKRLDTVDVVVSGAAAAHVHACGDLDPSPFKMTTRTRRQTQRSDILFSHRQLQSRDVVIIDGLPVTSIERTIADLVNDIGDLSLVADVVADASRGDRVIDSEYLGALLETHARRYGHRRGDGLALVEQLRKIAGIDDETAARAVLANPGITAAIKDILGSETSGNHTR